MLDKVRNHIKPAHKQSKTFFLANKEQLASDKFKRDLINSFPSLSQVISLLFFSEFMDAAPWPQDVKIGKTMEEISSNQCTRSMIERKARPQEQLNCPRCNSTNTKFCYYNNYSLTQPRYFCKTCRRYWTEGGSLRNVPVGGGSRKNKRSSSSVSVTAQASASSSSSSANSSKLPDLNPPNLSHFSTQNPKSLIEGQDLNLAFPAIQDTQALELLRTGIVTRGLNSYIQTPISDANTMYSSGFSMPEFKPSLGFSIEGVGSRSYGAVEENGGRVLFPLGEFKQQIPTNSHHHHHGVDDDQNKGNDQAASNAPSAPSTSTGFWNGMFGHGNGGSW